MYIYIYMYVYIYIYTHTYTYDNSLKLVLSHALPVLLYHVFTIHITRSIDTHIQAWIAVYETNRCRCLRQQRARVPRTHRRPAKRVKRRCPSLYTGEPGLRGRRVGRLAGQAAECINVYMYIHMCVYIYIYIERERETEI